MEILKQYYEALGTTPGASFEQIKQAYKDSVSVWHPDRFENNPRLKEKAQEKIKEINSAYEKLSIFFREYGAPNFENSNRQQSQRPENKPYKEPPINPEEPVSSKQKKYNYELKEAIWNPNVAAALSLIFTPAFGSYLLVINWGTLGQPARALEAKKWFYASLVMPILYFLIILFNCSSEATFLANVIPTICIIAWYFVSVREQVEYVENKYSVTYHRKPWGNAILGGVAAFIVYVLIFFVLTFAYGEQNGTSALSSRSENTTYSANNQNNLQQDKSETVKLEISKIENRIKVLDENIVRNSSISSYNDTFASDSVGDGQFKNALQSMERDSAASIEALKQSRIYKLKSERDLLMEKLKVLYQQ